jgi:hypothetical protein
MTVEQGEFETTRLEKIPRKSSCVLHDRHTCSLANLENRHGPPRNSLDYSATRFLLGYDVPNARSNMTLINSVADSSATFLRQ